MTDRELMQQALEDICAAKLCEFNSMSSRHEMIRLLDKAITALRERLAQPDQKPIAWVYPEGLEALKGAKPWVVYGRDGNGAYPDGVERFPLYLAPRQWQELTDEDVKAPIQKAMQHFGYDPTQYSLGGMATIGFLGLVKKIEAKLREKNT